MNSYLYLRWILIYTCGRWSGYRDLLVAFVIEKGKDGSFQSFIWKTTRLSLRMNASEEKFQSKKYSRRKYTLKNINNKIMRLTIKDINYLEGNFYYLILLIAFSISFSRKKTSGRLQGLFVLDWILVIVYFVFFLSIFWGDLGVQFKWE